MAPRSRPAFCVTAAAAFFAAVALASSSLAQSAGGYFSHIDDLPVMQGLNELDGAGVAFDKPGGRIVEAYAEGAVSASAVEAFYAKTLPALGWSRLSTVAGGESWQRESERLELDLMDSRNILRVRVRLTPR